MKLFSTKGKKTKTSKNNLDLIDNLKYKKPSYAPVAQLDRATDYESVGREFESLLAHQIFQGINQKNNWLIPFFLPKFCLCFCYFLLYYAIN